jgi:release factor glutamine methyltransferase
VNSAHITIRQRVATARRRLLNAGISDREAELDARLLAQEAGGWSSTRYLLESEHPSTPSFETAFDALIRRREQREPMAYILGRQEFWGFDIDVTPDVLIPRPETELLIEIAQELIDPRGPLRLADIGTGSGCIAVALARLFPIGLVTATDISQAALDVARRNAARHGVADRIEFVNTSLLDEVTQQFDFIAANPPYVPDATRNALQPEVRHFEPATALFGGEDGLAIIKPLLQSIGGRLKTRAAFVFEFGFGQAPDVTALIADVPALEMTAIRNDLQGIPRAAIVRRR